MIPVAIFHGAWNTLSNHGEGWIAVNVAMLIGITLIAWRKWADRRQESVARSPAAAAQSG
jgi:hypothetical protein